MLITNFSAGELSKKLNGRVDLQQYYAGASHISNFNIIPTGGIERRAGFERTGKLHGINRLIPFILDKDTSFVLEVTEGKTYIWKDGKPVTVLIETEVKKLDDPEETAFILLPGDQLALPNLYNEADLNEIQLAQNFDELILVHQKYQPLEIKYSLGKSTWTVSLMKFEFDPYIELDDDYGYIIQAEEELPEAEFDGQYCIFDKRLYKWSAAEDRWIADEDPEIDKESFTVEGKYPSCVAFFNGRLWLASTYKAQQKLWASAAPDTEENRYRDFSTWKKYVTVNQVIKEPDVHIFTASVAKSDIDFENKTVVLRNVTQDLTQEGVLAKDPTEYYCTQLDYLPAGTKVKSVTEDTVTLSYTGDLAIEEDLTAIVFTIQLWKVYNTASADDYEYKVISNNVVTADCSFNFELASDQNDAIKWIGANRYMTVGTESSVYCIPSTVTAVNLAAEMAGRYGSDRIQGLPVGNAMIFFSQGKKGIREYYYDNQQEAFQTNNIALTAEQMLTESAAIDFDFITNPFNRLVIVREDGTIATMLYDKNNGIAAWSRISHGNKDYSITSCAVVRGQDEYDIMYVSVTDGENYWLERLDQDKKVYLDSWQPLSDDTAMEEYGEGAEIFNATQNTLCAVFDITEDFTKEDDLLYIGYKYDSVISSMPLQTNDPTDKKRISSLLIRFLNSYFPNIQIADLPDETYDETEEPYSGIKSISYPGYSERDVTFTISVNKPQPCTILAVDAQLA